MLIELHSQPVVIGERDQRDSMVSFLRRLARRFRRYLKHRRARQELFEYLTSDHRAAADLGINRNILREWSRRPFWRI